MKRARVKVGVSPVGFVFVAMFAAACADGSSEETPGDASSTSSSDSANTGNTGNVDSGSIGFGEGIDASSSTNNDGGTTKPGDSGPVDTCYDPNDIGSSEGTAKALADRTDCDDPQKAEGVANGAVDVDFFAFHGQDKFSVTGGCTSHPKADVQAKSLELCMFVKCDNDEVDFQGCKSGTAKTSASGFKGCCAATPGTVEIDYTCNGTSNDSAKFFMRVSGTKDICVQYSINYDF